MPVTLSYPGVYIEEVPSGVRTITGVATSITAFIGSALKGSVNKPVRIQSFSDFERQFGGLWAKSSMSYAVQQYFLNGGSDAIVIRAIHTGEKADDAAKNATKAKLQDDAAIGGLKLEASSEGAWANDWIIMIDHGTKDSSDTTLFNLSVKKITKAATKDKPPEMQTLETIRNLSITAGSPRYVTNVLEQESSLIRVRVTKDDTGNVTDTGVPATRPAPTPEPTSIPADATAAATAAATVAATKFSGGQDGSPPDYKDFLGLEDPQTGLYALEQADLFNLLCIPPKERGETVLGGGGEALLSAALAYCKKRRAILIVDPPAKWGKVSQVVESDISSLRDENAVIFFPQIKLPDPLQENRLDVFPPCGAVAGIMARTDTQRGVWKAPAGIDATIAGVRELSYKMTDGENGQLNPLGINCLRTFPVYGNVVWGSRTLKGADQLASEWKYLPVRRLALFLEESLYRGSQWVVFEPNDEPLWAQIRLNIGAFMNNLFRQGAFQGKSPKEAYFVKCDSETTTQNDINLGIVNIVVGYAPLKPAEFVVIKFQQIAGQIVT